MLIEYEINRIQNYLLIYHLIKKIWKNFKKKNHPNKKLTLKSILLTVWDGRAYMVELIVKERIQEKKKKSHSQYNTNNLLLKMLVFVFWRVVDNVDIGWLKKVCFFQKKNCGLYIQKELVGNYFVLNVSMGAYKENQQKNVMDHCETRSSWMKKFIYYNSWKNQDVIIHPNNILTSHNC